jgi:hypothetical protein
MRAKKGSAFLDLSCPYLSFARRNSGGKTKKSRPSLPRALKKNSLQNISQNVVKTNRDNKNARYDDLAC